MAYWSRFTYVSVAEKKKKAAHSLQKLKKRNPDLRPVVVQGRKIAETWWGKAWNDNLERYADYSNRIGRGRSYVCNGAVLDLKIGPGEVEALVQGSRVKPYEVTIRIEAISKDDWARIRKAGEGRLDSLQEFMAGNFPKSLGEIFTEKGRGLFPAPTEIKFSCSCPDWAYMCKHVAAVLYGIGARLDEDPALFFTLRKSEMRELVSEAVEGKTRELLQKADRKSGRVMEKVDLSGMFGIDLEPGDDFGISESILGRPPEETVIDAGRGAPAEPVPPKRRGRPRKISGPTVRGTVAAPPTPMRPRDDDPAGPVPPKRRGRPRKTPEPTVRGTVAAPARRKRIKPVKTPLEAVFEAIFKNRKGIGISDICRKTGLEEQKARNLIYRLRNAGRIESVRWGVYRAV